MIINKNSAKAIIIEDNTILLIKKQYENGDISYTLPGGTQEAGELLEQSLVREVFEEVAAHIEPVDLIHVYEHQRPSKKSPNVIRHKIEFAFLCKLIGNYQPQNGHAPDSHQVAVEWVSLTQLNKLDLNPINLAQIVNNMSSANTNTYLASAN
jgi:ADP-ribose pyrophosphatase YjhB (NUDIX family)